MCRIMIESDRVGLLGSWFGRVSRPTSRMFLVPLTSACLRSVVVRTVPRRSCCATVCVAVVSSTLIATTDPPPATSRRDPSSTHQRAQRGPLRLARVACGNVVLLVPAVASTYRRSPPPKRLPFRGENLLKIGPEGPETPGFVPTEVRDGDDLAPGF